MADAEAEIMQMVPASVRKMPYNIAMLHHKGFLHRIIFIWNILSLCFRHDIQRIHVNQAGVAKLVNLAAQILRIPTLVHVRLIEDIPRVARLVATTWAPITLIFVSDDMKRRYSERASPRKNMLAVRMYDPFKLEADFDGLERSNRELICIGRLVPIKGQDRLLDAISICLEAGVKLHLSLIGNDPGTGDYESSLREQAARLGLTEVVEFVGYVRDVKPYLRRAAFIVIPSEYEPLGRIAFEAWDAGVVPLCSSESGGIAEIVSASKAGIIYTKNSPAEIAEAIITAQSMSARSRHELVQSGRSWASANASPSNISRDFRALLESNTGHDLRRAARLLSKGSNSSARSLDRC